MLRRFVPARAGWVPLVIEEFEELHLTTTALQVDVIDRILHGFVSLGRQQFQVEETTIDASLYHAGSSQIERNLEIVKIYVTRYTHFDLSYLLLLGSQPPSFLLFTRSSFVIFLLVSQILKNLPLMTFCSLLSPYFTHLSIVSFSSTFPCSSPRVRIHSFLLNFRMNSCHHLSFLNDPSFSLRQLLTYTC